MNKEGDVTNINELIENASDYFRSGISKSFEIKHGESSVMVSAPHSVEQIRNGEVKCSEAKAGALAIVLSRLTGCHAIYKTRNMNDDANYDEVSIYRDVLAQHIKQHNIKALIDLHQMAAAREQMVCIGTGFEKNIMGRTDFVSQAVCVFESQGISPVCIDTPFAASYPFTVSSDISFRCEIPCLQIEINSALLYRESEKYCADKVYNALCDILSWADKSL